jgi:hypothetical protein
MTEPITHYILDGTAIRAEPDVLAWARWFAVAERHVALTALTPEVEVSTVFIGIDHQFGRYGPPVLFETMVFAWQSTTREALDAFTERYSTWHEAERGHEAVCAQVRAWLAADRPA